MEPLETLLQITNEKGCSVYDIIAFINVDNKIAIYLKMTTKELTCEFLQEKQDNASKDSDIENINQIPPNETETVEAIQKVYST